MAEQPNIQKVPIAKVPTIKVLIQIGGKTLDLKSQGLVSLDFERYNDDIADKTSGILTELNMVLFDNTGFDLLPAIQSEKILIRYGYEYGDSSDVRRMSPVYEITPLRYNISYNNRGAMVGIGGVGAQKTLKFPAEGYVIGTKIKDIIISIAKRNGWNIGPDNDYIDIGGELTGFVTKPADMTDFQFISSVLVPMASRNTVLETDKYKGTSLVVGNNNLYTAILDNYGSNLELHVYPFNKPHKIHNKWEYTYGVDTKSQVIELTNKINFDWMLSGLTINIPMFDEDIINPHESSKEKYENILEDQKVRIIEYLKKQQLDISHFKNLTFNINFIDPEDTGYKKPEDIIDEVIQNILNTVNTIDLKVIGNPHIRAQDIIELTAVNKEGAYLIQSGNWRVVGISENINLQEYITSLKLVRDFSQEDLNSEV